MISQVKKKDFGEMKKLFLSILLAGKLFAADAQTAMADVFRSMPDSLMPYLSANNRLDMLDFIDAGMKAEVTNLLDGKSEMLLLTADSASIMMSPKLQVGLKLIQKDSTVVMMRRVYTVSDSQTMTVTSYFSTSWQPVSQLEPTVSSTLLRRDEKLLQRPVIDF